MSDRSFVIRIAAVVLALVVVGMVFVMLTGLFHPNVDNDKIFGILGPAFQMIIGCLVGLLGGMRLGRTDESSKPVEGADNEEA